MATATEQADTAQATDAQPEPQSTPNPDDKARELFDALDPDQTEGAAAGAEGEPKPQDETTEAEPESSQESDTGQPAKEDVGAAMSALLRDGHDIDTLNKWLGDDPEKFVAVGLKRSKSQGDFDRLGSEYQKVITQSKQQGENQEAEEAPAPTMEGILSRFQKYEQSGEGLNEAVQGMVSDIVTFCNKQIAVLGEAVNDANDRIADIHLSELRKGLTEDYPQLSDEAVYQEVRGEFQKLRQSGVYGSVQEAFRNAAAIKLADRRLSDHQLGLIQKQKQRRNGQPNVTRQQAQAKPTREQLERDTFDRLHDKHMPAG